MSPLTDYGRAKAAAERPRAGTASPMRVDRAHVADLRRSDPRAVGPRADGDRSGGDVLRRRAALPGAGRRPRRALVELAAGGDVAGCSTSPGRRPLSRHAFADADHRPPGARRARRRPGGPLDCRLDSSRAAALLASRPRAVSEVYARLADRPPDPRVSRASEYAVRGSPAPATPMTPDARMSQTSSAARRSAAAGPRPSMRATVTGSAARRPRRGGRRSPRGRGSGGSGAVRGPTTVAATRPNVPSPASTLPTSWSSAPATSARVAAGPAGDEAPGDLDRVPAVGVRHARPQRPLAGAEPAGRPRHVVGRRRAPATATSRTAGARWRAGRRVIAVARARGWAAR